MFILCPMRSKIGHDEIEAGLQRAGVAAEPLDGPVIALRHGLDASEQSQRPRPARRERRTKTSKPKNIDNPLDASPGQPRRCTPTPYAPDVGTTLGCHCGKTRHGSTVRCFGWRARDECPPHTARPALVARAAQHARCTRMPGLAVVEARNRGEVLASGVMKDTRRSRPPILRASRGSPPLKPGATIARFFTPLRRQRLHGLIGIGLQAIRRGRSATGT